MNNKLVVYGFKIFNNDLSNCYGMKFELNKIYEISGKIKWGTLGNGFHFCSCLEDTFRYYDALNTNIQIALVKGFGELIEFSDEYYGYYDMYVCSKIIIQRLLEHSEIINYLYKLLDSNNRERALRFISGYKLSLDEINNVLLLAKKNDFYNIDLYEQTIKRYQKVKL